MESFYLQLPSNGDPVYHPENTLSEYSIHLPKRIELSGNWAVALVELSYPHSFLQLSKSRTSTMTIQKSPYKRIQFDKYNFQKLSTDAWREDFASFLNKKIIISTTVIPAVKIRLNVDTSIYTIEIKQGWEVRIGYALAFALGFDGTAPVLLTETLQVPGKPKKIAEHTPPPLEHWFADIRRPSNITYEAKIVLPEGFYLKSEKVIEVIKNEIESTDAKEDVKIIWDPLTRLVTVKAADGVAVNCNDAMGQLLGFGGNIKLTKTTISTYPIDLEIGFYNIFVYTSLIAADEIVGNSLVPLLRCVPIRGEDGNNVVETYQFPFYKSLIRNVFHEINITLRDDTGQLIPFSPNGRVNVTLHFKKLD